MNLIKFSIKRLIVALIWIITLPSFGQTGNRVFDTYKEGSAHIPMSLMKAIVFSDSSVQCEVDEIGKQSLGYVQNQGFGEVFDPSSDLYDKKISVSGNYTIDSIGFAYEYHYVPEIGAAPDSLIFQLYLDTATGGKNIITGSEYVDPSQTIQKNYSIVRYDFKRNLGIGSIATLKYILSAKDSLAKFNPARFLNLALNNKAGIEIKYGHLFAFTVSYRPGFAFAIGDTISETWQPKPKKLHSRFAVIQTNTDSQSEMAGFENSLSIISLNRYNMWPPNQGWNGLYIPGTLWSDGNQFLWSRFYVHGLLTKSGISKADFNAKLSVYPNPTSDYVMIKSDGTSPYKYQLFNAAGVNVANGFVPFNNVATSIDISILPQGLYYLQLKNGNSTKTEKIVVIR